MDFSKLSEETMMLSTQFGPKQQRLLFDSEYFDDDCTFLKASTIDLNSSISPENITKQKGPGIAFFLDISGGSFCVRGLPVVENNLTLEELSELNHHFQKTEEFKFFPCDSIEVAEILTEQMVNRRYPLQDKGLVNISDPGSTWLLSYDEENLSLYFKSMGCREKGMENLGAIGDPQILRFWWKEFDQLLSSCDGITISQDEKGCYLNLKNFNNEEISIFHFLIQIFVLGDYDKHFKFSTERHEMESFLLYFNELSHSRRFWLFIEEILSELD